MIGKWDPSLKSIQEVILSQKVEGVLTKRGEMGQKSKFFDVFE